ncbi:hypothetical protein N5P32_17360 [Marinomonas pontica]|uniref:hypothetical protein n=1 Tax=Marinomonas pontica TaxID=264739 RepID=UPI002243063F|nr:hypothetical protein [Marinomonas pontica]MCW8357580.1 hypothetical protein [Marinomonas pontica]
MMTLNRALLIGGVAISGLTSTASFAEKWHMPTPYGDGNLPTQIAYTFAQEIKENTKGELDITVHSGGSLVKHTEIPRSVKPAKCKWAKFSWGFLATKTPCISTIIFPS